MSDEISQEEDDVLDLEQTIDNLPIYINALNAYWRGHCMAIYDSLYETEAGDEDVSFELDSAEELVEA